MRILFNSKDIVAAKEKEVDSWKTNGVYEEIDNCGQNMSTVRWVVIEKIKNKVPTIKARLVVRRFQEDTTGLKKHSPTCSKEPVRLAIAVACSQSWTCHTVDVNAAYLQGDKIDRNVLLKSS